MSVLTQILTILGALGIFLFGMKVMSEGIQKVAGDGMRRALATMTKNRFSAAFTGFFTTSLVQSSSATTVLVVSFVNAGLLTLTESIGVIMGANLGTTITAWLVAFIGKFSISKIALPIIGVGLPMFFAGKGKWRAMGETLIGFGLLFFGLSELKGAVPNLKELVKTSPEVVHQIQYIIDTINGYGFGSTILFLLAGIILTLVVQSSSAAMAITITCAWNGWFGSDPVEAFKISAAVVLGENIGTTVTAWLASLGASVNAKRAARAHFLFNVLGTIWALALFSVITKVVWATCDMFPDWLIEVKTKKAGEDVASGLVIVAFAVAVFHTAFNLLNICFLIPFVNHISNLVQKWVKDKPEGDDAPSIQYISQNLVDLGELNIAEADKAIQGLAGHCNEMFSGYIKVFENPDEDMSPLVTKLKLMEDEADVMMHDITAYLVRCSSKEISRHQSERITGLLRITAELEECSDAIYRLIKIAERKYTKGRAYSPEQTDTIREFASAVDQFSKFSSAHLLKPLGENTLAEAKQHEAAAKELRNKFTKAAMTRMANGGDVKVEMLNIDTINHLAAISNHTMHIVLTSREIS